MAACTSRAAASILRFISNCRVTEADPRELDEVIWFTPAMRPNWRSRGVATAEAMVSGLAPGKPAPTPMTGKSTSGNDATGKMEYATEPANNSARLNSEVATGRLMKGAERCMALVSGYRLLIERRLRDVLAQPY